MAQCALPYLSFLSALSVQMCPDLILLFVVCTSVPFSGHAASRPHRVRLASSTVFLLAAESMCVYVRGMGSPSKLDGASFGPQCKGWVHAAPLPTAFKTLHEMNPTVLLTSIGIT